MNSECIIIFKPDRQNKSELFGMAAQLRHYVSNNVELFPVAISKITTKTATYKNYNKTYGKTMLYPGDYVLFVSGKLHHMNKTTIRHYTPEIGRPYLANFELLHPDTSETFFEDIRRFE